MQIRKTCLTWMLAAAAFAAAANNSAAMTVIDFEDLRFKYDDPNNNRLPANYAGFSWNAVAGYVARDFLPGTGYQTGTIGSVSMFNAWAEDLSMSRGSLFDFAGAYITAAWNVNEKVTVEGWRDGALEYTSTIEASYPGPVHYDFGFNNINRVVFRSLPEDGVHVGSSGAAHIVIDNITYSVAPVPEPSTWLLLGFGTLALLARRRFGNSE
ncbi:MAG: hypothetical protein V7606_1899 [Burkholderiales bacterium]